MRKFIALVLAMTMVFSMAVVASAENTTTLTTNVPSATYTLSIPADQVVPFGTESMDIGIVKVTESAGFAVGKNLQVDFEYEPFSSPNVSTTIPYTISYKTSNDSFNFSENRLIFLGRDSTTVNSYPYTVGSNGGTTGKDITTMVINIYEKDWGKALAGEYTTNIVFTAEIVAG